MTLLNRLPIFPLYYFGNTKFMPIHCSDLTDVIFSIISKNIDTKIIECVGPETMTFKEILQKLLLLINKKRILLPFPFFWQIYQQNFLNYFQNLCLLKIN